MRHIHIAGAAVVLCVAGSAHAAGHQKAGLWETTSTMTLVGMPFTPPPQTVRVCVTPEQAAADEPPKTFRDGSGCKYGDLKHTGDAVSATLSCDGEMKGSGSFHAEFPDPEHYSGGFEFTGNFGGHEATQMKQSFTSKWLQASCK